MNPNLRKDYNLTLLKLGTKFKKGDIIAFEIKDKEGSQYYAEDWILDIKRTAFVITAINSKTGVDRMVTLDKCGGQRSTSGGIWNCGIYNDDWDAFNIYKLTKKSKKRIYSRNQRLEDLIL